MMNKNIAIPIDRNHASRGEQRREYLIKFTARGKSAKLFKLFAVRRALCRKHCSPGFNAQILIARALHRAPGNLFGRDASAVQ